MKTILILLLAFVSIAHAQLVTRTGLKAEIGLSNAPIRAALTAAGNTNAAQQSALAGLTNKVNNSDATNAAQQVALASLTNSAAAKMSGSFTLSNFVAYLVANGVTNIAAGTNAVLYVADGTLIINGTGTGGGSSLTTNLLPVIQVTNVLAQNIDADSFNVGTMVVTNTIYLTRTNAGSAGNYVADFAHSEETIMVGGNIVFLHATNLLAGVTNTYIVVSLMNFSGSDRTLTIPAAWKESINFPTTITNSTVLQLALKNYGGLSQSNVLVGAAQF